MSFLLRNDSLGHLSPPSSSAMSTSSAKHESEETLDPDIALICISGTGDFDHVKNWCESATKVGGYSYNLCVFADLDRNLSPMDFCERWRKLSYRKLLSTQWRRLVFLDFGTSYTSHDHKFKSHSRSLKNLTTTPMKSEGGPGFVRG
jgi:hypothetical protein